MRKRATDTAMPDSLSDGQLLHPLFLLSDPYFSQGCTIVFTTTAYSVCCFAYHSEFELSSCQLEVAPR